MKRRMLLFILRASRISVQNSQYIEYTTKKTNIKMVILEEMQRIVTVTRIHLLWNNFINPVIFSNGQPLPFKVNFPTNPNTFS